MPNASDDYERLVQSLFQTLAGNDVTVHHKREYKGRISRRSIIVDVSYEFSGVGGAKFLVLIECKRYRAKVEVGDVEEFQSKLHDIGAHKGIMVTTIGYQSGAIEVAKGHKMALTTFTADGEKILLDKDKLYYVIESYDDSVESPRPYGPFDIYNAVHPFEFSVQCIRRFLEQESIRHG